MKSSANQIAYLAVDAVFNELTELGFDATREAKDDPRTISEVFIIVEHRPEGAQGDAKLREQKSKGDKVAR